MVCVYDVEINGTRGISVPPTFSCIILYLCHEDLVESDYAEEPVHTDEGEINMLLSAAALAGQPTSRTMQFVGNLGGHEVRILVDSGNNHSFLSSAVASRIQGISHISKPVSVTLADGASMRCTEEIVSAEWSVQGYSFHSNLKILPLSCFDMIVGMDWLEAFSPMKIHWLQRWMSFPYGGSTAVLRGLSPSSQEFQLLQLFLVSEDTTIDQFTEVHPDIQPLLRQYEHIFAEPTKLPPHRDYDHRIPLVPSASPVAVRQYRYSLALKSEIEAQVSDMLPTGFIRPSSSAFSSPVLLVHKKDGNWRFCVD